MERGDRGARQMPVFRLRIFLTLLVLSLVLYASVRAATMKVDGAQAGKPLGPSADVLEDKTGLLDFAAVQASGDFRRAPDMGTNFGFTRSTWWLRFTLANDGERDRHLLLRQDYPLIDNLDFWAPAPDGGWRHTATGDRTEFSTREFAHRDFIFDVELPAKSERTFYVRGASGGPLDLNFTLYDMRGMIGALSREQLAYGVYYGGFLVLVLYNFFIFLIVRDRAFFYYLLYATSYGMYFAIHNGIAFEFLWPHNPAWGNQSLLVMLSLTLVFGLQFTRTFLDTSGFAPRLDKLAVGLQALAAVGLAASFAASYSTLILPLALLTVLVTVLIIVLGILGLIKGFKPARLFMIAWGMFLLGVMTYMLKVFGLLPHNALTQNGFQVGSLLEMVLLSLALASRLRDLRYQSRTDTLTKVPNRRHFDEQVAIEFERAKRTQGALALLVIDIDHFKRFNDEHGHARGDEVLKLVANHLFHGVRRGDSVCRYGGEEFAVILPGANGADAVELAESLRRTVQGTMSADAQVTISVGVASTADGDIGTVDELFRAADRALYRAKDLGRNRVVRYDGKAAAVAA